MKKSIYFIFILAFISALAVSKGSFAVKHQVMVGNFFFNPSSLNVYVGDTIRWVLSAGGHTTTSTPGAIPAGAASWDSPINSSNTSFEYKVTVAGSYAYVCTPHAPGMAGTFTASVFTPTLSVSPSNRSVTSSAGTTSFTVSSNSSWTTGSNASWCTVTTGGSGNGSISTTYSENTSFSSRVATITVTVAGLPAQTVTVTQDAAAPLLTVGPSNQNVAALAGTTSFNVTSNTSWTVSSSAAWCTVNSSGSGNATITASFTTNAINAIRIATLTVTVTGLTPQTVTVTQAASTVGVSEQSFTDLQVYPNPTKGIFKFNTPGTRDQVLGVSIMDISGKTIFSKVCTGSEEYTMDLSLEPRGIYFIRINSGNTTQVRRIVLID